MILLLLLLLIPSLCFGDSEITLSGNTAVPHIIQSSGVSLRPRPYLDFEGIVCVDLNGKTVCNGEFVSVPSFSNDPCIAGQYSADSSYFYICQSNNIWLRTPISSWAAVYYLDYLGKPLLYLGNILRYP